MNFRETQRLEAAIVSVFEDSTAQELSAATISKLAQLATVLASGYLEATCREVVLEYTRKRANENIVHFVSRSVGRFANPKMDKMLDLLRSLDEGCANELSQFVEGQLSASVNSIVANRHRIAHGRSTQISMAQVKGYFADAQRVARKMSQLFGN